MASDGAEKIYSFLLSTVIPNDRDATCHKHLYKADLWLEASQ